MCERHQSRRWFRGLTHGERAAAWLLWRTRETSLGLRTKERKRRWAEGTRRTVACGDILGACAEGKGRFCGQLSNYSSVRVKKKKKPSLQAHVEWKRISVDVSMSINLLYWSLLISKNCWFISLEHTCCLLKLQFSFLSYRKPTHTEILSWSLLIAPHVPWQILPLVVW